MPNSPKCMRCGCEYVYEADGLYVCPECSHEWPMQEVVEAETEIKDAYGVVLKDGDSVAVIKDLKVKGSSLVVKVGTKVKNIRIQAGDHDIDCKIPGIGKMNLKSEFVKKIT